MASLFASLPREEVAPTVAYSCTAAPGSAKVHKAGNAYGGLRVQAPPAASTAAYAPVSSTSSYTAPQLRKQDGPFIHRNDFTGIEETGPTRWTSFGFDDGETYTSWSNSTPDAQKKQPLFSEAKEEQTNLASLFITAAEPARVQKKQPFFSGSEESAPFLVRKDWTNNGPTYSSDFSSSTPAAPGAPAQPAVTEKKSFLEELKEVAHAQPVRVRAQPPKSSSQSAAAPLKGKSAEAAAGGDDNNDGSSEAGPKSQTSVSALVLVFAILCFLCMGFACLFYCCSSRSSGNTMSNRYSRYSRVHDEEYNYGDF